MKHKLENLEQLIHKTRGLDSFYETGKALKIINDEKLYKFKYRSFENYCLARWDMARRTAYQLINASLVIENVRGCASILPENEYQARPLTKLNSDQQRVVWQRIVQEAPEGKITAKYIKSFVDEFLGKKTKEYGKNQKFNNEQDVLISGLMGVFKELQEVVGALSDGYSKEEMISKINIFQKSYGEKYNTRFYPVKDGFLFSFLSNLKQYYINFAIATWSEKEEERQNNSDFKSNFSGSFESSGNYEATDPNNILGISKNAKSAEISKAYRVLSKKYHPDALNYLNIDEQHEWIKEEAESRMKELNRAYDKVRERAQG